MSDPASIQARQSALAIVRELANAGFQAYWVGGCVRDMLMGREPKDYDVATNATPDQVLGIFPRALEVGKAFGVVQVLLDGGPFHVATFRRDATYEDGRHPDSVEFTSAEEDARRRDFTINGLFYDPIRERVLDFVHGQEDIAARRVRTIGHAEDRFSEDHLRMLRAVRFASTLEFKLEEATAEAIRAMAPRISDVSAERIQQELTHLLTESPRPGDGLKLLREVGLLKFILPEVEPMAHQQQPPAFHPEGDVFTHTALMLNAMKDPTPQLAYAVLLHDVGKPPTAEKTVEEDGTERWRFHGHAKTGSEMAEQILRRLKLPGRDIEAVCHCIRNHMRFIDVRQMRKSTLREIVGAPTFPLELELHRLDCVSSHGDLTNYEFLVKFVEELKNEPVLPAPWITGRDLLALGIPEGPQVGAWHKQAYEAQLDGRFANREELLAWVKRSLADQAG